MRETGGGATACGPSSGGHIILPFIPPHVHMQLTREGIAIIYAKDILKYEYEDLMAKGLAAADIVGDVTTIMGDMARRRERIRGAHPGGGGPT